MARVFGTTPSKPQLEQHTLHVGTIRNPVMEATGRPKSIGLNAAALFQSGGCKRDVMADDFVDRFSFDQPRRSSKAKLHFIRCRRQDVNMIVRMVADRMPLRGKFFEPVDVWLFEHASHTKVVDNSPALLRDRSGLESVTFRRFVEIPFLEIPFE